MSTGPLPPDAAKAWLGYQRMRVQLSGRLTRELSQATGLSEADYDVLLTLSESADNSMRSIALRCGLRWEKSRLSHQIRRMEQRGLVTRHDCVDDNRSSVVALTEKGREAIAAATELHEAAVRRYMTDALSAEQLAALAGITETVLAGLGDGAEYH